MLEGDDWLAKWEAKVVSTAATLCDAFAVSRVTIICIHGGKHCDKELAREAFSRKQQKKTRRQVPCFTSCFTSLRTVFGTLSLNGCAQRPRAMQPRAACVPYVRRRSGWLDLGSLRSLGSV